MSDLHISWRPALQPATRYYVELPECDWRKEPKRKLIRQSPHLLARCWGCGRLRRLANLLICEQAWYDPTWHCRDKDDCRWYSRGRKLRRPRR
jgi:hypothetical protein